MEKLKKRKRKRERKKATTFEVTLMCYPKSTLLVRKHLFKDSRKNFGERFKVCTKVKETPERCH